MSHRAVLAAVVVVLAPGLASAFSGGPPPGRVKLCGTSAGACNQCHTNPLLPSVPSITLTIDGTPVLPGSPPAPQPYTPGQSYTFVLSVVEGNPSRCVHAPSILGCGQAVPKDSCVFGFEMAAVKAITCGATPAQGGSFINSAQTQLKCTSGTPPPCLPTEILYIEHLCASTLGTAASNSWTFQWTAPVAGTGPVSFWFAINSANANGNNSGDAPWFNADAANQPTFGLVIPEKTASADFDLRKGSVPSLTPPVDKTIIFSDNTTCPGTPVVPMVLVSGFTALPVPQDVDPASPDPLIAFQVAGPTSCPPPTKNLFLTKIPSSSLVRVTYQ